MDITRQKQIQVDLMKAKKQAEISNLAKSEFIANMSHEIRTPINSMIGFTKILQDQKLGRLNKKQLQNLEYILESSQRLLSIINDILDISKVEAGKLDIKPTVFIVRMLMERISHTLSGLLTNKKIKYHCQIDQKVTEYIKADEQRIEQVLKNLVGNAVKFTSEGRIEIFVNLNTKNMLQFEVTDTGIGIA